MKKRTVKRSTMLNLKGFLILIAFGVWVTLMMEIGENTDTLKNALMAYGSNTLFVVVLAYVALVILGLFLEGESAE